MWITSLLKGLCLGTAAYGIGAIMDITISTNSFNEIVRKIPTLYQEALNKMQKNMLIITPIIYAVIDNTLIDHSNNLLQPFNITGILAVHSVGYYVVHKSFHVITCLRKFHDFHHKFDYFMIPSIGNAVSTEEFLIAYVSPFIIGAYIIRPNEISFIIPISLISIFNNIIHTKELRNVKWVKYLVSPDQHIEHHEVRTKNYSAPIFNLDYFLE